MSDESKQDAISTTCVPQTLNDWKFYYTSMKQAQVAVQREATPESSEESSFELDESFRALLERKKQQLKEEAQERKMVSREVVTGSAQAGRMAGLKAVSDHNDSTFIEQDSFSKLSDTSFEEMERMCAVLDKVSQMSMGSSAPGKEGGGPAVSKPTTSASTTLAGDVTQLEDIEEPSGLWENSMLPGVLSPMKRVHLFRPSTIIEESTFNAGAGSKDSSVETIDSSTKPRESRETEGSNSGISGSEIYRTAEDTFASNSYAPSSAMGSSLMYDSASNGNQTDFERQEQQEEESCYSKNTTAEAEPAVASHQEVIILDSSASGAESDDSTDESQQKHAPERDPLVIEYDESDDDKDRSSADLERSAEDPANLSGLEEMPDHFNDTMEETDFMLKQGMKLMAMKKKEEELQKEAQGSEEDHSEYSQPLQSKSRTNSESDEGSAYVRHMARTPVDKGGMAEATETSYSSFLTPSGVMKSSKQNVAHGPGSGCKQTLFSSAGKSNSARKYCAGAPSGGTSTTTTASGGTFKRPAVSRLPQMKAGRKFDHIVSPIGAYIKKTPQSMLQTRINCPNRNLIDVLHSENRDSVASDRGSKENLHGLGRNVVNVKGGYTPSLPGKGVISSNRAHVLDERNPVRIPGGEKMQKLINNSPTMVIRHEGRIRYAGEPASTVRKLADTTFGDDSLKDISVASNDVSVRVLHDAKRF